MPNPLKYDLEVYLHVEKGTKLTQFTWSAAPSTGAYWISFDMILVIFSRKTFLLGSS